MFWMFISLRLVSVLAIVVGESDCTCNDLFRTMIASLSFSYGRQSILRINVRVKLAAYHIGDNTGEEKTLLMLMGAFL